VKREYYTVRGERGRIIEREREREREREGKRDKKWDETEKERQWLKNFNVVESNQTM
jgi:hypothetical protein